MTGFNGTERKLHEELVFARNELEELEIEYNHQDTKIANLQANNALLEKSRDDYKTMFTRAKEDMTSVGLREILTRIQSDVFKAVILQFLEKAAGKATRAELRDEATRFIEDFYSETEEEEEEEENGD